MAKRTRSKAPKAPSLDIDRHLPREGGIPVTFRLDLNAELGRVPSNDEIMRVMKFEEEFPPSNPRRHYFRPDDMKKLAEVLNVPPSADMWYRLHFLKARFIADTISSDSGERARRQATHKIATYGAESNANAIEILCGDFLATLRGPERSATVALRSVVLNRPAYCANPIEALAEAERIKALMEDVAAHHAPGPGTPSTRDALRDAIAGLLEIAWIYAATVKVPSATRDELPMQKTPAFHYLEDAIEIFCDAGIEFVTEHFDAIDEELDQLCADFERVRRLADNTKAEIMRKEWRAVSAGRVRNPIRIQMWLSEQLAAIRGDFPA
jgi:hypothetical protein